jgi:maltooligosyltrehalose trehalohydrolase
VVPVRSNTNSFPRQGAEPIVVRLFGALPETGGVQFRTVACPCRELHLEILTGPAAGVYRLERSAGASLECFVEGARAGDTYSYLVDGVRRPDPASRFQPEGVHGPSEIVDPDAFRWRHDRWPFTTGDLVIYELHVGTFTERGTFAAARERLPDLRALGVTAIELMPVAAFAGRRNWGYDGVDLYAPSENYGRPEDLRELVDTAHGLGLGVILDVVYNHLGPEGAYLSQFLPDYITDRHATPWGGAVNLDGEGALPVRSFIVDNAVHWIREYRLDGLRLDATHSLVDDSRAHIVAEIATSARAAAGRPIAVFAEDHRNLVSLVDAPERGGWGVDGIWADDFHHVIRRRLAGDCDSYYQDYSGSSAELARTLTQGWLFTGQHSRYAGRRRGTDPSAAPMNRFVICLQNHDQIGNRPTGDRLHHTIDAASWRAASALLLTAPMTPLLFIGQEWAASSPFQFFTDLEPGLGAQVTEGRRREFKDFPGFSDPAAQALVPDPQDPATFERSRLAWSERTVPVHQTCLSLYTELLRLRVAHGALAASPALRGDAEVIGDDVILMRRESGTERLLVVVRLAGAGPARIDTDSARRSASIVLTTEEPRFAVDPRPPEIRIERKSVEILFHRPGAVILAS